MVVSKHSNKQALVNEVMLMKLCDHPNIVHFCGSYLVEGILWVAMELITGVNLQQLIFTCKLSEPQIALIIREVSFTHFVEQYFFKLTRKKRRFLDWLICIKKALFTET